jgi:hypothetical protein
VGVPRNKTEKVTFVQLRRDCDIAGKSHYSKLYVQIYDREKLLVVAKERKNIQPGNAELK